MLYCLGFELAQRGGQPRGRLVGLFLMEKDGRRLNIDVKTVEARRQRCERTSNMMLFEH